MEKLLGLLEKQECRRFAGVRWRRHGSQAWNGFRKERRGGFAGYPVDEYRQCRAGFAARARTGSPVFAKYSGVDMANLVIVACIALSFYNGVLSGLNDCKLPCPTR